MTEGVQLGIREGTGDEVEGEIEVGLQKEVKVSELPEARDRGSILQTYQRKEGEEQRDKLVYKLDVQ